jgi:23S rRNA pseudouridine2605 synthase
MNITTIHPRKTFIHLTSTLLIILIMNLFLLRSTQTTVNAFAPFFSRTNTAYQFFHTQTKPAATATARKKYAKPTFVHSNGVAERLYRADRVLANRSGKSRSECHALLLEQRVALVSENKTRVISPNQKISLHAKLVIDYHEIVDAVPALLVVYNKPKWMLSVRQDNRDRNCLGTDLLPQMHPVGRLDYDSSGLLLFSSHGGLTQTLLHPKHEIAKEYKAVVTGNVDFKALKDTLKNGVKTSEGTFSAKLLNASVWETDKVKPYLQELFDNLPPEYNKEDIDERGHLGVLHTAEELTTIRLVVDEGKYRMVRRILANAGHPVVSLHRERIGEISLGDTCKAGEWRELTDPERAWAELLAPKKKL